MILLIGEFLGTLLVTYVVVATQSAVAVGIALTISILLIGKTTAASVPPGANFNPAIMMAAVAAGKVPASTLIPSIVAQIAGALVGLEFYKHLGVAHQSTIPGA